MSKEILQQALDALNHIYASTPPYKENGDCTFLDKTVEISNAAIAALEVAIMQPVKPLEQFIQAVTDPENQPSQYGTVTLDYHFKKIKEWEEKFDHATNKRITDIMQPVQPAAPVAQAEPMKDGEIAKIVNDLRDVAMQFQTAGQLRERIAQVIVPVLKAKGGAA